jgi:signal transduction histidine kinase/CheY-like chemotaxis protein
LNTLADTNPLADFDIGQRIDKNIPGTPARREYRGPVPYSRANEIPLISDFFDFLRENQSRSVDFFLYLKHLEHENEDLKHQLQQTQKMEAIGDLSSGIVHDFNNILHPIIGNLERLIENTAHDISIQKPLKNVLKGANRASTLVKQILNFSHRAELEISPVKIQHIIREVIKLSRSILPATIKIIQAIDDECGLVMVDSTHIHQIVMNLITNAAHAMRHKEGILDISLKEIQVMGSGPGDLSLEPGAYVCLSIADTGEGIDASIINRVFEPYFTTKKTGTGLGLPVISRIVKSYGGDIYVTSEPGRGSRFQVYIPRCHLPFSTTPSTGAEQTDQHGCESILFVDDDPFIVEFQQEVFENYGYRVTPFVSSLDAFKEFKSRPKDFDIVICDMTMPNMTGLAMATEIKKIRPDIPVIISTGFSETINKKNYQEMGVDGFLMKPGKKETSLTLIRHLLDKP